ncbi:MAG: hopanoid biosynthesis associated radical SAM protein HpnJ [Candidatus Tectomicrobia bacterium]|uniref:Hopanoid biosynthesis associated radical SAM protein HpnJ n=1 Tax=Tectimicrobiota bacterium TaxID=2528274 RepID=A0A932FWA7_UNCTE|nr:hopanoid biosynthesis associated radical SAM protein HpnJ [Candidatus Tectomicrobia bacterium]
MNVLFLNPPSYEDFDGGAGSRYQAVREVKSFWYPTWLCYPAGLIPTSRVLDAPAADCTTEETLAVARDFDLVVIYTSTASLRKDVQTAERIKTARPGIRIAFVGPHPSILPEETLQASPAIDLVAHGEFDYTLQEIAEGAEWSQVRGISYRQGDRIFHNPSREFIEDLDSLPFVTEIYQRDLDIHRYRIPYLLWPYVSIYTGRGCPGRCIYCLWPQTFTGHRYRMRSVENVFKEVRQVRERFPEVQEIFFDDDTFTANPSRALQLCQRLRPLGLTWSTTARVDSPREMLKAMKEAGLRLLVVGYESGSQAILNHIRKGTTLAQAREFTRECQRLGIQVHGAFILGLLGETAQTIEESIRFACSLDLDTIQVSLATPYPGTKFYEICQENGYLAPLGMVDEKGYQVCPVSYPGLAGQEIFQSVERFYKRFYSRPRFLLSVVKRMIFDRSERERLLQEGAEFRQFLKRRREYYKR